MAARQRRISFSYACSHVPVVARPRNDNVNYSPNLTESRHALIIMYGGQTADTLLIVESNIFQYRLEIANRLTQSLRT